MPKKRKTGNQATSIIINLPANISKNELKLIIVDGLLEFEAQRKRQEQEEKASRGKEWQDTIGVKDFSETKRPMKWLLQFCNEVKVIWRICTISSKNIKGDGTVFSLIQIFILLLFAVVIAICALISAVFMIVVPVLFFLGKLPDTSLSTVFVLFSFGLFAFMLFQVFRIASFEVINIEDRNYLFSLFTCVVSTVSVIIAVIALFTARGS